MTKTKITEYYANRASEYERIYQKPERQRDLVQIKTKLSKFFNDLNVLEIACGTGYWTQFACRSAKSITAIDYNAEVLNIASEKDYGNCPVKFVKADAFVLDEVDGLFNAALVGFWWSHVPMSRLDEFLEVMHSKLSGGACIVIFDNRYVEGNSTPISRTDDEGNTYQMRKLSDGSTYEVLKNFPSKDYFIERISSFAQHYSFTLLDHFWIAQYTL